MPSPLAISLATSPTGCQTTNHQVQRGFWGKILSFLANILVANN